MQQVITITSKDGVKLFVTIRAKSDFQARFAHRDIQKAASKKTAVQLLDDWSEASVISAAQARHYTKWFAQVAA
jgi:hypothetical protein